MLRRQLASGESFKEALNRQWAQCSSFFCGGGESVRRIEKVRAGDNGVLRDEGRGKAQPHRIEWNSSSTEFGFQVLNAGICCSDGALPFLE